MNIAAYKIDTPDNHWDQIPTPGTDLVKIVINGLVRWSDRRIALRQFYQVPPSALENTALDRPELNSVV